MERLTLGLVTAGLLTLGACGDEPANSSGTADTRSVPNQSGDEAQDPGAAKPAAGQSAAGQSAPNPAAGSKPNDQDPESTDPALQVPSLFARFVRKDPTKDPMHDDGRFETAITTYRNEDGVEVSLIGAIHIADAKHYTELQQDFTRYDALLYELVAQPDDRPKPGDGPRGSSGPLGILQRGMKEGLELEFQLDAIDYTPDNFVHADLTPEGFADSMEQNGETILTTMLNMMMRAQSGMRDMDDEELSAQRTQKFDLVKAFRSNSGRHMLRMMFAEQLIILESLNAGDDTDASMTLLEGRNDRALEVLDEQISAGKKNIGIYYGAAHMPDIEKKLIEGRGFEKVGHRWLLAWDVTRRPDETK